MKEVPGPYNKTTAVCLILVVQQMSNSFLTKLCFLSLSCPDEIQSLQKQKKGCGYFNFATCKFDSVTARYVLLAE